MIRYELQTKPKSLGEYTSVVPPGHTKGMRCLRGGMSNDYPELLHKI